MVVGRCNLNASQLPVPQNPLALKTCRRLSTRGEALARCSFPSPFDRKVRETAPPFEESITAAELRWPINAHLGAEVQADLK